MDLEDEGWVSIPYDGLLEVHDDGGKKFFSRKYVRSTNKLFKMDYFDSPRKSQKFVDSSSGEDSRLQKQLVPLPIQLDDYPIVGRSSSLDHHEEEVKEITKHPILIKDDRKLETDQDPIFQVFFKKENEFVEMKVGSPRFSSQGTILPHIETNEFQYEAKSDDHMLDCISPSKLKGNDEEKVIAWGQNNERLNIWKWGLSGIGAFCSLGMAAATICIIIFGHGQRHKQHNQKLRIEFYSDNKRLKQVVHHSKEARSEVKGVPLAKAHITYGGYYEDL